MPRKIQQSKQADAFQPTPPVATCRGSIWSPQETVGAHFQWAQVCATGVDTALSYLRSAEPGALDADMVNQDKSIQVLAYSTSSDTTPPTAPIYIVSHVNPPLVVAQTRLPTIPLSPLASTSPKILSQPLDPLSARELEVLRLLATGCSNQEIADTLIVARSTIKWYLKQIYSKLGAHSRTQAIAHARQSGLIP